MFKPETVIDLKRQSQELSAELIGQFVEGISSGVVTDAQLGGFTMAVRFNGMSPNERTAITLAMRDSGSVLKWDLDGPVLDKHSTGGVGDGVSLMLAPMIAACGGYVPMISGRGLGHTGGTLDKLESIPGYRVQMPLEQLQKQVRETGMAMVGQGPELAPADGRMYAIRDVCSTLESIPLIVSSILAKKLAEGLDGLILDVKTGNGAFMLERERSRSLAEKLCTTAVHAGTPCSALITDMNQPLGWTAGNALEINEAIDFLTGIRRNPRLEEASMALASELLVLGSLAHDRNEALRILSDALGSGRAAERFSQNVAVQGGPTDLFEKRQEYLPQAPLIRALESPGDGWISGIDTRELGMAVVRLGGGRLQVEDTIDPRVGLSEICSLGDQIETGQPLCMIHADNEDDLGHAAEQIRAAISISESVTESSKVVYEIISGEQEES